MVRNVWAPAGPAPRSVPRPEDGDLAMDPISPPEISPMPGGRRVLVVDDNVDAAETLALLLRLLGHEVVTTHDGTSGVELASSFRPELILMDIGMPGIDGYEATTRIRRDEADRGGEGRAMISALTGWGQEEDRRRSREAGFDYHYVKPVDPDDLQQLLDKLP